MEDTYHCEKSIKKNPDVGWLECMWLMSMTNLSEVGFPPLYRPAGSDSFLTTGHNTAY